MKLKWHELLFHIIVISIELAIAHCTIKQDSVSCLSTSSNQKIILMTYLNTPLCQYVRTHGLTTYLNTPLCQHGQTHGLMTYLNNQHPIMSTRADTRFDDISQHPIMSTRADTRFDDISQHPIMSTRADTRFDDISQHPLMSTRADTRTSG